MPEGDQAGDSLSDSQAGQERAGPLAPFRYPNYRLLWLIGVFSGSGFQMQQVVNSWLVYELTHDPFALGLLGVFRAVPIVGLSLFGGAVVDAMDRRRLLLFTQAIRGLLGVVLLVLAALQVLQAWHIYVVQAMSASASVFDGPARQAMLPATVPRSGITSAIVLNSTTNQLTRTIGPTIAGLFLAIAAGPVLAYAVNAGLFLCGWLTVWRMHMPHISGSSGPRQSVGQLMKGGLVFVKNTPVILGMLLLDALATFFTAYDALLPIFARDVLGVGPQGFGLLASAPSFGSFVGAATVLFFFSQVERRGRVVLLAVLAYGLAVLVFSLSPEFVLSFVALMLAGLLDQSAVTMRNSVLLLLTPNELRGRVESIRLMFIQGGPTLGAVQAGALASVFGAPIVLAVESLAVLVIVAAVHLKVPAIWSSRIR